MGVRAKPLLRILVADQHPIIRAGIKALLAETSSWQQYEVDVAETTEEAIALIASGLYPVVLMEYNLPGIGCIKATEVIMTRWPHTCVIVLTDTDDGALAERAISAGAKGCILRNVSLDILIIAIRTVMAGKRFYSNEIAQQLITPSVSGRPNDLERLTTREREVLIFILNGYTDRQIAVELAISKRTVDKHRQHINYKLGTRTPLELVQAGLRLGLIRLPEQSAGFLS